MKYLASTLILGCLITLTDCASTTIPTQPGSQKKIASTQKPVIVEEEKSPSNTVTLQAEVELHQLISDTYDNGKSQPLNTYETTSFSLNIPQNWSVRDGIFLNEASKKLGEMMPPIKFILKPQKSSYFIFLPELDDVLLEKSEFAVNDLQGTKYIVQMGSNVNGKWYRFEYRIINDDIGYRFAFYSNNHESSTETQWDRIVHSLKIYNRNSNK